jgi:hypothetical protein
VWIHFALLGKSCLLVREFELGGPRRARSSCLLRWDRGRLEIARHEGAALLEQLGGTIAASRSLSPRSLVPGCDPRRFIQLVEHQGLLVLIDRYNHLAVLNRRGELVSMFFVNGDEVAAWLPDGTCWGSRRLLAGEVQSGAAERIAAVLRAAEEGTGSRS